MTTLVQLSELIDAFQWTSATGPFEHAAFVDRKSGRIWWVGGDSEDEDDPVPDDLEDGSLYLAVPDPLELGLGRRLALRFAEEQAPQLAERVYRCFERAGAYGRFKGLLEDHGLLQGWYDYEAAATGQALREWAAENGFTLVEPRPL
ncbi:UPF0158 family protein [Acidovorax sp.]|uniref:UPF0158 family protein n=1 Tax=Acidovorax sp. TaxID=1872122 RepID=UPI002ACE65DB|nr:UPF0158 family protein [Acidovorax sp.]MDZ7862973.1 hypothetical protein [Acidovorax sp.]